MRFDDKLRLASSATLSQNGGTLTQVGEVIDLGALEGETQITADPFGGQPMGVYIRVTSSITGIGGASGVEMCGFVLAASKTAAFAPLTDNTIQVVGSSEPLAGLAFTTFAFRNLPQTNEELFFMCNPLMQRTATGTSPQTSESYYTPDDYPRYLGLIFWTMISIEGYTAVNTAINGGTFDAWLVNGVPTIQRGSTDFSSYV